MAAFYLTTSGSVEWPTAIAGFLLPTLLGNIVVDVLLVAVLNHTQVVADEPNTW